MIETKRNLKNVKPLIRKRIKINFFQLFIEKYIFKKRHTQVPYFLANSAVLYVDDD